MPKICLYFQIHQPWRLKNISIFDLGKNGQYFGDQQETSRNQEIMSKVSEKSYVPMLTLLSDLTTELDDFRFSLSVSGVAVDQMRHYCPEVLQILTQLASGNQLEFLGETYYHSLASLYSTTEFFSQVCQHKNMIADVFGQETKIFRNTELIYDNRIADLVQGMGFEGMLTEGADKILRGRRPTRVYHSPGGLPLLLKHYLLSDDIAFRFSQSARSGQPLTAETFCHWINSSFSDKETINLFMDFETFGEHQWEDTGIFDFFHHFVKQFIDSGGEFVTVSEAVNSESPVDVFDSPSPISWADTDRDTTAWRGNGLQTDSLNKLYRLEDKIINSGDTTLIDDWRKLQTSDHFYYMCTKWASDGDVHAYFSPFESPHLAYRNYSYAIADLNLRLKRIYG